MEPSTGEPVSSRMPEPLWATSSKVPLLAHPLIALAKRSMGAWRIGHLTVHLPDGTTMSGGAEDARPHVTMWVRRWRMIREFLLRGDVGVGESYTNGDWQVDDLPRFIELALVNREPAADTWMTRVTNLPDRLAHTLRGNSRRGSRRNIGRHYDLSNDLFALFLDPSMTYSSAVFESPGDVLEVAQRRKFDWFGRALGLGPDDHVLEVGCGWGAFAIHAARTYGCRVTGITISREQYTLASRRVGEAGLADRVDIQLRDYRDLSGRFTKIVSIEMLEAVGREHWPRFFEVCHDVLAENGLVGVQVITIPDHRFAGYARRCDWIQKHVFPGGMLPSVTELGRAMIHRTPFTIRRLEDIGPHYAETLARWRASFLARQADVLALGLDERFVRLWDYYLASCEGAFRARAIGDVQMILGRAM